MKKIEIPKERHLKPFIYIVALMVISLAGAAVPVKKYYTRTHAQHIKYVVYYQHFNPEWSTHKTWTSIAEEDIPTDVPFGELVFRTEGHPCRTEVYSDGNLVIASGVKPALVYRDDFEDGTLDGWSYVTEENDKNRKDRIFNNNSNNDSGVDDLNFFGRLLHHKSGLSLW